MKNKNAVALGKLKKGVKERKSTLKSESSKANAAKARAAKIKSDVP